MKTFGEEFALPVVVIVSVDLSFGIERIYKMRDFQAKLSAGPQWALVQGRLADDRRNYPVFSMLL